MLVDWANPGDLKTKSTEMANFKEMYKNPLFVILLTYFKVMPVDLVVALISSLLLKRNPASIDNQIAN